MKLPIALEREPLVDAVFEVRMRGNAHMADLLPGALYGQLEPKPTIHRLPAAEIPQPIRDTDPNLLFAPVIRLDWGNFSISFGDRNLVIACKLPYPKWPNFKSAILDIVSRVSKVGLQGSVERFSVKYVNLIEAPTISEQISKINMSVRVGEVEARDDHLSLQLHQADGRILHILSVVTGAQAKLFDDKVVFGAIVDVDSIRTVNFGDFGKFAAELESAVEELRQSNKAKFFSCLTSEAIDSMGPRYD